MMLLDVILEGKDIKGVVKSTSLIHPHSIRSLMNRKSAVLPEVYIEECKQYKGLYISPHTSTDIIYNMYINCYSETSFYAIKEPELIKSSFSISKFFISRDIIEREMDDCIGYREIGNWVRYVFGNGIINLLLFKNNEILNTYSPPLKLKVLDLNTIDDVCTDISEIELTEHITVSKIKRYYNVKQLFQIIMSLGSKNNFFSEVQELSYNEDNIEPIIPTLTDGTYDSINYLTNNSHLIKANNNRENLYFLLLYRELTNIHKIELYYDDVNELYWLDVNNRPCILDTQDLDACDNLNIPIRTLPLSFGGEVYDF